MKKTVIIVAILVILGIVIFMLASKNQKKTEPVQSGPLNKNGVLIETLEPGAGEEAKSGDKVTVNYVGTFENGTKFDSSIDRGMPFSFVLGSGQVIKGWDIGVEGMKVGEKVKLTIPPGLAYGSKGAGNVIPPNATLIFEVELLGIGK